MKAKMGDVQELLSDDLELLLREIDEFNAAAAKGIEQDIPKSVEDYLLYVARTGNTIFPWQNIRPLFRLKLKSAIGQFQGEPSSIEPYVFERFDLFRSAPFTIQRLSELITKPNRHYKIKDKFVSALEKTVFVVSTVEPKLPQDNDNFTNGSEENNSSSSEDGLTQEMNITFDTTPHNDYNTSIGIELPSISSINNSTGNEDLRVEPDTVMSENLDTSVTASGSGDHIGGASEPVSENNGFTNISEPSALIQDDSMSFQNVQSNVNTYNHSEESELNAHVSSIINAENAVTSEADAVAVASTVLETTDAVAVSSSVEPPSDTSMNQNQASPDSTQNTSFAPEHAAEEQATYEPKSPPPSTDQTLTEVVEISPVVEMPTSAPEPTQVPAAAAEAEAEEQAKAIVDSSSEGESVAVIDPSAESTVPMPLDSES